MTQVAQGSHQVDLSKQHIDRNNLNNAQFASTTRAPAKFGKEAMPPEFAGIGP
jgi:hypothetical protein